MTNQHLNDVGHAEQLFSQGQDAWHHGQREQAWSLFEQSSALFRRSKDLIGVIRSLHSIGNITYEVGRYGTARVIHEHVLSLCKQIDLLEGMASSLNNMGLAAARQGDIAEGLDFLGEGLALYTQIQHDQGVRATMANIDVVHQLWTDHHQRA
jgi:tetratricopeptide (TPR) repeat protein